MYPSATGEDNVDEDLRLKNVRSILTGTQKYDEIYYLDDNVLGRDSSQSNFEITNYNLNVNVSHLINQDYYYVVNEINRPPSSLYYSKNRKDNTNDSRGNLASSYGPSTSGNLDAQGNRILKREEELYEIEEGFSIIDGKRVKVRKEIVRKISNSNLPEMASQVQPLETDYSSTYLPQDSFRWVTVTQPQPQYQYQYQTQPQHTNPQIEPRTSYQSEQKYYSILEIFECMYIGRLTCNGLWGIKFVREPIDTMVGNAKKLPSVNSLQRVRVTISETGVRLEPLLGPNGAQNISSDNRHYSPLPPDNSLFINIGNISYAAQDSVYRKIFTFIVVNDSKNYECFAFLCSTSEECRRVALAMTSAFQAYAANLSQKASQEPTRQSSPTPSSHYRYQKTTTNEIEQSTSL